MDASPQVLCRADFRTGCRACSLGVLKVIGELEKDDDGSIYLFNFEWESTELIWVLLVFCFFALVVLLLSSSDY